MHCNRLLMKYIQIDILVILISLKHGNGNYLGARGREYPSQRNANNNNGVKSEDSSNVVNSGGVRAVGEVFVPKTFSLNSQEPTCEQLRAMWIFSKRQSRAAEITNEIPTYRDPFTYNVWDPLYSTSRVLGSIRMSARERARSPVFGRVVSREPITPQRMTFEQRQRFVDFGSSGSGGPIQARIYGAEGRQQNAGTRRSSKNRYMGVPNGTGASLNGNQNSVAVQGSFQKLKELIWTERAKELTQQRRDEELAARAAALKEIANGQIIQSSYTPQPISPSDSILMDENRSPEGGSYQYSDHNRMSILSGQNLENNKNNKNEHGNRVRATTRRVGNSNFALYNGNARQAHKEAESMFSGNYASAQSGRGSRIQIPATELFASDSDHSVIGIPRTYPIRPSHFRERNRSLLKEQTPNEHFQRFIRGLMSWPLKGSPTELRKDQIDSNGNHFNQLDILGLHSKPSYVNYLADLVNDSQLNFLTQQIPKPEQLDNEFSEYVSY
ncbi:uncharacterized protein LOC111070836 [Drosophila obscura]|uniref:uncharacterized protein LOC111070836 n=1 Tax=Drosophila obscura TaxID=7282 RepID=UPI001BB238E1|nr:uncharacterized protein LOC111070836 [Drosophila obscura]XP_022217486.2 uncharacterized protein LOC111070836 [Drosophila obscura]